MKILLIANPVAGGDARPRLTRVESELRRCGCSVETVLTGARGDAERTAAAARCGPYDRIVAAGGDGTLNEVVNGLVPASIPLAFIPLGTVNVLALELGIPLDPVAAARCAVAGTPRPVGVGSAGGRKFLLMAGIGFDAAVVRRTGSRLKRRIGRFAYVVAAAGTWLRWRAPELVATLADGTRYPVGGAIVGNARLYGGRFSLTPGARLDRGAFEVLLLRRCSRLALLRTALRAVLGLPHAPGDATLVATAALTLTGDAPVQIDGDDLGDLPLHFAHLPAALALVHPPAPSEVSP